MINFIRKLFPKNEQITHPSQLDAFLKLGMNLVLSNVSVTPKTAMTVPAINRGVHLLSDMVAMLPLMLYEKHGRKRDRAKNHSQYEFIHDAPNRYQGAYSFRYLMQRHLILRGRAYAFKIRLGKRVIGLNPIHPDRVETVQDDNFNIVHKVMLSSGLIKEFGPEDIFHLAPHTEDGITGIGIVKEAPESIGMCIAAEHHGAMLFGNGAMPGGILSTDNKLTGEQVERLKESWDAACGGENKYKTAVVDGGMKWNPTAFDNEKAQYLELRNFQVAEAARLLGVPPILLYHSDKTSTFGSAKELVQAFLKFSLDPWLTCWESAYNREIVFQGNTRATYFVEFVRQGLEKMDLESRVNSYGKMVQNRIMNPNEVREKENMNPYDGGDEFLNPNITPGGQEDDGGGNEN